MADISAAVLAFIRDRIDSVEQLEALLLLKKHPDTQWTAEDLSRALSTQPASAAARLKEFHATHLVSVQIGEAPRYHYSPSTAALDHTIAELAEAYAKYPVRIINLIYSKPIDKIRTFSDAFKFKKEDQ
jgi:hypothetical protein